MIKKSVDDAVFDAVLAKAFEDAAERDLAEMQTEDVAEYSEAYKKMERRYYNKVKRQSRVNRNSDGFAPALKRVVSFVLIIGFVSCCVMLSAPTIRAEFMGMISQLFDKCFSITLPTNATTYETDRFVFKYIPESYSIKETFNTPFMAKYSFTSSTTDDYFAINIHIGSNILYQYDSSYIDSEKIDINSETGYLITSDIEDEKIILWTDSVNMYRVCGTLSETELIEIAVNISAKNEN